MSLWKLLRGRLDKAGHPRPYRPQLEALETRDLLSVCTVDRLTDNNPGGGGDGGNGMGDLRWCIVDSLYRDDTINFSVAGTINLAAVLPALTRGVSIEGPGADLLTVRRHTGGNYKIVTVPTGVTASISGLTISNGNGTDGSGIYNAGTLIVSDSTVSGNINSGSGNSFGGGIYNQGTLNVSSSTVSGNVVIAPYGSGSYGGGIYNAGTLTVSNSTISGNTVDNSGGLGNYGGGIYNLSSATLTISNSTIANNTNDGGYGGGILNDYGALTVTDSTVAGNSVLNSGYGGGIDNNRAMTTRNTIIAGNTASNGPDVNGSLGSQGHNLIGNPLGMAGWVDTDLLHVDARLGPLQDNGGPTRTMALLPGSPALNAGAPDQLGVPDQRGVIRSGGVNIGAYQASASAFVLTAPDTVEAGLPFDVTMTAVDPFGQVAVGYTGTATFSSGDPHGATLPPNYTFQPSDQGMVTFAGGATLYTAGTWDVTATDTTSGITGSAFVSVQAAPTVAFQVIAPANAAPGTPFDVSLTALDPYGNTDVNYTGTVTFATTDPDPGVQLPADYTFQPSDTGMVTFPGGVTLITQGDQTITATDTASGITGSAIVTVAPPGGIPGRRRRNESTAWQHLWFALPSAALPVPSNLTEAIPVLALDEGSQARWCASRNEEGSNVALSGLAKHGEWSPGFWSWHARQANECLLDEVFVGLSSDPAYQNC